LLKENRHYGKLYQIFATSQPGYGRDQGNRFLETIG